MTIELLDISTDCSQPSIFSYFYLIVEHAVARELDVSTKVSLDWVGVGIEINIGAVDIFAKKVNSMFLQKRKTPIG